MSVRRLRTGELLALAGAIAVIVALTLKWYEHAGNALDAWDTFGPAVVLLMLAAAGGVALALATVAERSTALPVAAAVWGTLLGVVGTVAGVVRLLERPQHATALCAGSWLAALGALAVLVGCWLALRDERPQRYPRVDVTPRPPPPPAG